VVIPVQINGKLRDTIAVPPGLNQDLIQKEAAMSEKIKSALAGKTIAKVIWVQDKLLNLVVK